MVVLRVSVWVQWCTGRAWLNLSLNEQATESYLRMFLEYQDQVAVYYTPWVEHDPYLTLLLSVFLQGSFSEWYRGVFCVYIWTRVVLHSQTVFYLWHTHVTIALYFCMCTIALLQRLLLSIAEAVTTADTYSWPRLHLFWFEHSKCGPLITGSE